MNKPEYTEIKLIDKQFKQAIDTLPYINSIRSYIELIQEEENPEVINIYIEAIQHGEDCISLIFEEESLCVKDLIKNGFGDFLKIKEKCIKLKII